MPFILGISTIDSDAHSSKDMSGKNDAEISKIAVEQAHRIQLLFQKIRHSSGSEIQPLLSSRDKSKSGEPLVTALQEDFSGKGEHDLVVAKEISGVRTEFRPIALNTKSVDDLEKLLDRVAKKTEEMQKDFSDSSRMEGAKKKVMAMIEEGINKIADKSSDTESAKAIPMKKPLPNRAV